MPLYNYQCVDCKARDQRVAGLDDHTARCLHCGGTMARQDPDPLGAYAIQARDVTPAALSPLCPWCSGPTQTGTSEICPFHAAQLQAEIEVM